MPRRTTIKFLRTTKANLDAQKAISNLIVGEPYLITDTSQFAIADAPNNYKLYYSASEVQTALDGKAEISDIPTALSELTDDATHRIVTDTEKSTWNAKANIADIPINFDSLYYRESEIDTKLLAKSDTTHNHTLNSLSEKSYNSLTGKPTIPTNFDSLYYSKSEVDSKLNLFTRSTGLTSLTIDCSTADIFEVSLSANASFSLTNVPTNKEKKFIITNSGASEITITYPNTADYWESATFKISAGKKKTTALEYNGTTRFWYLSAELINA